MDSTTRLILALHCHQPTGNTEEVFVEAHDRCYRPIVDLLHRFHDIRMSLHYSGPLLEWFEKNRPETIAAIRELATRRQVEILGGGWQEPLLSVVPPRDAVGQLRTMRYECARLFGVMPRGMWLAERVWEPDIPALVHNTGYSFTFVDDTHLRHAGILDEHITGHWITEKHGHPLTLLPISRSLRYAIPFRPPSDTIDLLTSHPGTTWTYGDDGEKFGLWPKTHEWVWEKKWLEQFLTALTEAQETSRIATILPSSLIGTPPSATVYPPTDSYREMGEWSLPVDAAVSLRDVRQSLAAADLEDVSDPFIRGGIWSGFLARYPESNWMHKHMLRVSDKLAQAERASRALGALPVHLQDARNDLYRSQTNCAYWHGLFGGLYLPHLRRALWRCMLLAENAIDPVPERIRLTTADLDCDGRDEILVETPVLLAAISPLGGCVAELIHRPTCMNLTDTLARRPELYHSAPSHAPSRDDGDTIDSIHDIDRTIGDDLQRHLVYDAYPRRAFQDILLAADADPANLETSTATILHDLRAPSWEVVDATTDGRARITLRSTTSELTITKQITIHEPDPRITVTWELAWSGESPLEAILVTQINVDLLAGHSPTHRYELTDPPTDLPEPDRFLDSRGTWHRVASIALVDDVEHLRTTIEVSPVCDVNRHPINTVSQSESGFQLTYQGSCIQLCWPLHVESWAPWRARASLSLTGLAVVSDT